MKPLQMPTSAKISGHLPKGAASQVGPAHLKFHFPEGVLAFENAREFLLICKPESLPFVFMRAVEPARLGFVCVDPFLICPDYQPRISEADTAFLELTNPADVLLLSIVNPALNPHQTTANLQGPLAINLRTGRGKQIICDQQQYPVRYAIWEALGKIDEAIRRKESENEAALSAA